ncbi:MAG: hypothetical protein QOE44_425 [Solirubrobacteraceae bacterium]|jgi:ADP-ribose pyrophosphatase YjhB (NUDIX family)|nr:hypothetical protein [Solirubrobacteraceae bacterium]
MRRGLKRLVYRVASPVAHGWWSAWRIDHEGCKCVVREGGAVVLVRHTYGDRRRWDLPGGFIRRGEAPVAAARRELREELGLGLTGAELESLGALSLVIGRRTDTVHYFRVELADRVLDWDDGELAEVGWFEPTGLPDPVGEHVEEVLARIPGWLALASVETDPGSPDRG